MFKIMVLIQALNLIRLIPFDISNNKRMANLNQPTKATTITPNDSTNLTRIATKGIYVSVPIGATTTLAFKLKGDSNAVTVVLTASQYLPGNFLRVMSTGTTLNGATIVGYGD